MTWVVIAGAGSSIMMVVILGGLALLGKSRGPQRRDAARDEFRYVAVDPKAERRAREALAVQARAEIERHRAERAAAAGPEAPPPPFRPSGPSAER